MFEAANLATFSILPVNKERQQLACSVVGPTELGDMSMMFRRALVAQTAFREIKGRY